jgi:hypothetical protein
MINGLHGFLTDHKLKNTIRFADFEIEKFLCLYFVEDKKEKE